MSREFSYGVVRLYSAPEFEMLSDSEMLEDVENKERGFEEVVEELRGIAPKVM